MYSVPISALLIGIAGVVLSTQMKTRWYRLIALGVLLTAIAILIQRFTPIASAMFDSSHNLMTSSDHMLIRYLAGIMAPISIIMIVTGLLWGSRIIKKNTDI